MKLSKHTTGKLIKALMAERNVVGATSARGRLLTLVIEQLQRLARYRRPRWAKDTRQTLPGMLARLLPKLEAK